MARPASRGGKRTARNVQRNRDNRSTSHRPGTHNRYGDDQPDDNECRQLSSWRWRRQLLIQDEQRSPLIGACVIGCRDESGKRRCGFVRCPAVGGVAAVLVHGHLSPRRRRHRAHFRVLRLLGGSGGDPADRCLLVDGSSADAQINRAVAGGSAWPGARGMRAGSPNPTRIPPCATSRRDVGVSPARGLRHSASRSRCGGCVGENDPRRNAPTSR